MINVLFVCMGNICRSPMAEAVFIQLVKEAGLSHVFEIDSAGTIDWHAGEQAHRGTLEVLRRNNIPYHGRSRPLRTADLDKFDYIVVMDKQNMADAQRIFGRHDPRLTMFMEYANKAGITDVTEVPDPYYSGGFDEVYELVLQGGRALLAHIQKQEFYS
jgi:protein-tyrosine phosphatase